MTAMPRYDNFRQLQNHETVGEDYRIQFRIGKSGIAVIAPHGGGIEPGTSELADAIAGDRHAFYSFEGLKPLGNLRLHITSRKFDEPICLRIVKSANIVLALHGCRGDERTVYIGGRDRLLKLRIGKALKKSGFSFGIDPRYPGLHIRNICNRCITGKGVQLEIPMGMRRAMFHDISRINRKNPTDFFGVFTRALKSALSEKSVIETTLNPSAISSDTESREF